MSSGNSSDPTGIRDLKAFYRDNGYTERKESAQSRADRVRMALWGSQNYAKGGRAVAEHIKDLLKRIHGSQGAAQARRVEQASDKVDLSSFDTKHLDQLFMPNEFGVSPGLLTTMPPKQFENFALPISEQAKAMDPYPRWQNVPKSVQNQWKRAAGGLDFENYVDNIAQLIDKRGMPEPPMLWLGKQDRTPNIVAHEGRHRMRGLQELGEDTGLVQLRPGNYGELAGAPDEVTARMLEKYFNNDWAKQRFYPESHTQVPRPMVKFPEEVFAGGGAVDRLRKMLPERHSNVGRVGKWLARLREPLKDLESEADSYTKRRLGRERSPTLPEYDESILRRVAPAFDEMQHDPSNPAVRRSYEAMIDETMDQYKGLDKMGYRFSALKPGDNVDDAYRLAYPSVRDKGYMKFFPTDQGFGTGDMPNHPLLRNVGKIGDLPNATANDAFRIVHDMYGHFAGGNPYFDNPGEDLAFLKHAKMYSKDALPALASETRGQNAWVTFGPHGEYNRSLWPDRVNEIIYAPQKAGIMPPWAYQDAGNARGNARGGAVDRLMKALGGRIGFKKGSSVIQAIKGWRTRAAERLAEEGEQLNAGRDIKLPFLSPDVNTRLQTIRDPSRVMFPGIYKDVPDLLEEAKQRWIPDPGKQGPMFQLFGHTRESLDDLAQGNRFMQGITPTTMPWSAPARARGADVSEQILTDRNARRIQNVIGEALQDPQLRTTRSWYELSPMYDWMNQQGLGLDLQRGLNTRMGVMSPGSNPITEINRGFHAHYLAPQERWEDLSRFGALPVNKRPADFPEDLYGLKPHPYMNTAAMPNLRSYETTGQLSSPKHKVPTYVMASDPVWQYSGRPVADAHFTRFLGYPDVRGANQTAGLRKELSNSEYGDLVPWWSNRIAKPLGIDERDAQALMWNVGGPQTGVSYIGAPKLEMISNYIKEAAERGGMSLDEAAYQLLSGQRPFEHGGAVGYAGGGNVYNLLKYRRHARPNDWWDADVWAPTVPAEQARPVDIDPNVIPLPVAPRKPYKRGGYVDERYHPSQWQEPWE